jgi:Histidine kinase-, DNA gyrase B-, and HSP90-like ATPase
VIELSRYVIEPLRKDEDYILYRGRSQYDGSQILALAPLAEHPAPEILKRLEHECSLREELDPKWVARPVAMACQRDRTVLVLEDPARLADSTLSEAEGACVLIAVRDSGPGVDPKDLDRLFDAFYTTKPQGLGMGLAISRSIIEAHGGRLWAKANQPRGTVFQFTLPVRGERIS